MKKFKQGNISALDSVQNRKGWFIGHFIDDIPEFKVDEFEVCWGDVKKEF